MDFKSTSLLVHVHCSDFLINTFSLSILGL
jgi:hypothetical protein